MSKHIKVIVISIILSMLIYRTVKWQVFACAGLFILSIEIYMFLLRFSLSKKKKIKESIYDKSSPYYDD